MAFANQMGQTGNCDTAPVKAEAEPSKAGLQTAVTISDATLGAPGAAPTPDVQAACNLILSAETCLQST